MSPAPESCVFCSIVDDLTQAGIVWEDDWVLGFMDINPVTDGHVLVVPKVHVCSFTDVPHATAARMMNVAQWIAAALKTSGLRCEEVNLMFAGGEAAFQEVFHAHLHVIPWFVGDGFTIDASWIGRSRDSLAASANAIRRALRD